MPVYGLLGRKLGHSYSPVIHKFLGGYDYRLFEVEPEDLANFLQSGQFAGLNVTIPYKQAVIPFCAELSPAAKSIGSVNTILYRPDGSLYGDNTDPVGFATMLERGRVEVRDKKVLVLGSGGSSLSVKHVLGQRGAGEVVTVSRAGPDNYTNLERHSDCRVIINTTPVGMSPNTGGSPIGLEGFPNLEWVLDLIYNPARTRLMLEAKARGIPCIGGLTMLIGQARSACELFIGGQVEPGREEATLHMVRSQTENIVFVGMPGCGKTSIGELLAQKMDRPFVDSDAELIKEAGISIPEIFAREGENGFRARESAVLERLGGQSGLVIATGGGCVTRDENYFHLRSNGRIVFLERNISQLPRDGRPLSAGDLDVMYERRLPLYHRFADLRVENNATPEQVAARILQLLEVKE
ncbi:MAG: AAA family ATPase [Oscillospiraceae bacterium]|nr:AAA family ATPase [Oscillospiraceae bacterium]